MRKFIYKYLGGLYTLSAIIACGGGSSSGTQQHQPQVQVQGKASIYGPVIIQSTVLSTNYNYAVIQNNSTAKLSNLKYTVTDVVGSGNSINLDNVCQTIAPVASCTLPFTVKGLSAVSGSFRLNVLEGDNVLSSTVIGVQNVQLDTKLAYADGISLFYNELLPSGSKYAIVTGVSASSNVPTFSQAYFTHVTSGLKLPNQSVLSGNLGGGLSLAYGSDFTVLATKIPGTGQSQLAKLKIEYTNGNSSYSNARYAVTTTTKQALINLLPPIINLTKSQPEQILTIYNYGDSNAILADLVTTDPTNIQLEYMSGDVLKPGSTKQVVLKLKNKDSVSTSSVTLHYNNSANNVSKTSTVYENLNSNVKAETGLNVYMQPDFIIYKSQMTTVTKQMVLTNAGVMPGYDFSFTLPQNFSISNYSDQGLSCTVVGNTVTNSLASGQSCILNVMYSNTNAAEGDDTIKISYKYNNKDAPLVSVGVHYKVVDDGSVNVSLTPKSHNFGTIKNDGIMFAEKEFTLTNSGNGAININTVISGSDSSFYKIIGSVSGTPCTDNIAPGTSCAIRVRFITADGDATGIKNAMLVVTNQQNETLTKSTFSGEVISKVSQDAIISMTSSKVNFSGNGSVTDPYAIEQGKEASLIFTFKNSGLGDARNFYVENVTFSNPGWTRTSTCGSQASPEELKAGSTCSVTFTLNTNTPGNYDSNSNKLIAHWVDATHPDGKLVGDDETISVSVFATAKIEVTTLPNDLTNLMVGDSFKVVVNLTGGHDVADQQISLVMPDPNISYIPDSCVLNMQNRSCQITVTLAEHTKPQLAYGIQVKNTGEVSVPVDQIPFSVYANHVIFVTTTLTYIREGNWAAAAGGDFDEAMKIADKICNDYKADTSLPVRDILRERYRSKKYKALIYGNNATSNTLEYYRRDGLTKIATANGGNLVESAPIENSIGLPTSGAGVWTGAKEDYLETLPVNYNATCDNWTNKSGRLIPGAGFDDYSSAAWWQGVWRLPIKCSHRNQFYCASVD